MVAAELGELLAETLASLLARPAIAIEDLRVEPPGPKLKPDSSPA